MFLAYLEELRAEGTGEVVWGLVDTGRTLILTLGEVEHRGARAERAVIMSVPRRLWRSSGLGRRRLP